MPGYQVTCHTPGDGDADRHIEALGGIGPRGGWWYPADTVVRMIGNGAHFYVALFGRISTVIVGRHPGPGRRYLTTEADGVVPSTLLDLPHCPEG